MSAQETAEAILIVIKRIAKWIGIGLLILAALTAVGLGGSAAYDWLTHDRYVKDIKVTANFNPEKCTKDYPLSLTISNNSNKTILNDSVYITVTNKGRSTQLNDYSSLDTDVILEPGRTGSWCFFVKSKEYPYPHLDGTNMVVEVTRIYVNFKK